MVRSDQFQAAKYEEKPGDNAAYLKWLGSILIIGEELGSGNFIAIDYNRKKSGQEPPVIFISHETPFSCSSPEDEDSVDDYQTNIPVALKYACRLQVEEFYTGDDCSEAIKTLIANYRSYRQP